MSSLRERFEIVLKASGLHASLRRDDAEGWIMVWQGLQYQPVAYASAMIDYQLTYFRDAGFILDDVSLVLKNDEQPCGLWPLALGGPVGEERLTSNGGAVMAPIFMHGISPRTQKRICSLAVEFMREICESLALHAPIAKQGPQPHLSHSGISEWHEKCMSSGARIIIRHELYTDLHPRLAEIRSNFRKSFKALVNVGLREWLVFTMDRVSADPKVWAEFKELHQVAAARVTRGDDTWNTQFRMVCVGEAFLVGLRNPADGRMVGAGFFQITRDEGMYAVAAYDRNLFHKPLGHVVQQKAIEIMKASGLSWYQIGDRPYRQEVPAPTEKQLGIAGFKQGFASHQFCRYEFQFPAAESKGADVQEPAR